MIIRDKLKEIYIHKLLQVEHNTIYAFHHVSNTPKIDLSPNKIDTETFRKFVLEHGPYVDIYDVIHAKTLNNLSAITFDDGLADVYYIAYPFLAHHNIPFSVFVLRDMLNSPGYLTSDQVREMSENPIVTIGSHGCEHMHLGLESDVAVLHDLYMSKKDIEAITGQPCNIIAYPFGSYNKQVIQVAEKVGYTYGLAVKGRPILQAPLQDRFEIPRLSITNKTLRFYA